MTDKRKTTSRPSSITKNGSTIEMMFPKQNETGKPLDLAKQRAMPQIKQDNGQDSENFKNDVVDYSI